MPLRRATDRRTIRGTIITIGAVWAIAALTLSAASPARAEGEYTAGTGSAKASLLAPAVVAGNLAVNVIAGDASASYQDRSGSGLSTLFDVPLVRLASGGGGTCGVEGGLGVSGVPPVGASTAPSGDTEPASAVGSTGGQLFDQRAAAEPGARGSATTSLGTVGLPPLVELATATATAETSTEAETMTRTATATSTIGDVRLLGGLITLKGLRWELHQTLTGPDHRDDQRDVDASFSLGGIALALPGVPAVQIPIPLPQDLGAAFDQVNGILGPLGLQIRLPKVTHNPEVNSHTISPLQIAIGGDQWALGPVFAGLLTNPATQQLVQSLLDTLFDTEECNQLGGLFQLLPPEINSAYNTLGGAAPLVFAVIAGALGGTGEIQLSVGGVTTTLDDTYYPPLQISPPNFSTPQIGVPPVAAAPNPGTRSPLTSGEPADIGAPVRAAATTTECRSTSPAGKPGCWLGHGAVGAAAAGLFTLGLLGVDEALRRRRLRNQRAEVIT